MPGEVGEWDGCCLGRESHSAFGDSRLAEGSASHIARLTVRAEKPFEKPFETPFETPYEEKR